MTYATVVKRFNFEAAHDLPNHDGKCRGLHGHSYKVEVGVDGIISETNHQPDEGMVIDFSAISEVFKRLVFARCDHQYLNDVLPVEPTTAENIALWILREMRTELPVSFVRVWETATGYAEVKFT